jgi:hypothetical protein
MISICLLISTASANGAKPMQDPSGNGGLIFDENPGIALLNETISFNLKDSAYITLANVTVEYEMKNLLEQDQSFDMFFVIPPAGGYDSAALTMVHLNEEDITKQCYYKSMDLPSNWKPAIPMGFIEPFSKESYETHFQGDRGVITGIRGNELNGIHIPISVKANSTIKLHIQYPCAGGYTNSPQYYNSIYNYMYYLTPAKYWEQEPQVTLNVALPESKQYAFHSSIPMEKLSANSYTVKLDKLPDSEWIFSFVDKKGLIYGTNSSKTHTLITLSISLSLLIMGLLASLKLKSRIYTILGYVLAVVYFYVFKGNLVDGYIGEFLLMIPISLIMILIIPVIYYKFCKNNVENESITRR